MEQPRLEPYLGGDVVYPKTLGELCIELAQPLAAGVLKYDMGAVVFSYGMFINPKVRLDIQDLRRAMWHKDPRRWADNFWWLRGSRRFRAQRDAAERFAVLVRNGRRRADIGVSSNLNHPLP